MSARQFFRIVYNIIYYFLYLVLLAFLLVTPADFIDQARHKNQNWNIIVIILCYAVTILIVFFVYATRLFINRSVLASIPKPYIPIEKGDVPRNVRLMIVEELSKSAAIAFEARPRLAPILAPAAENPEASQDHPGSPEPGGTPLRPPKVRKGGSSEDEIAIKIPPHRPVWGEIEHPGWGSPTSPDLPNLQYSSVILELPNLIEAKALTLAPPDRESPAESGMLDAEAVSLLQRAENMGLREYLAHLAELGVVNPLPVINEFIATYENARYSTRAISNDRFRHLMHLFADILRNMHPWDPATLEEGIDDDSPDDGPSESDVDDNAPNGTNPSTPGSNIVRENSRSRSLARRVSSSTASSQPRRPYLMAHNSSANTWQFRTAPNTPKSRPTGLSHSSSTNTFAQTRHPYPASQASSGSIRSVSGGSVIRLATPADDVDLPYVLNHPHTM